MPEVTAQVRAMGLEVDDEERELAQTAGAAVLLTTSALAFLSLLICVLAAVNIAHALSANVRAREKELGVYRAVGARKRDVRSLVMAEGVLLGLVGGLAGTLVARLLGLAVDAGADAICCPSSRSSRTPSSPFPRRSGSAAWRWACWRRWSARGGRRGGPRPRIPRGCWRDEAGLRGHGCWGNATALALLVWLFGGDVVDGLRARSAEVSALVPAAAARLRARWCCSWR